jgi:hypothetical protein
VPRLFFRLLGPLSAPFGAIDDVIPRFLLAPLGLSEPAAIAFRHNPQGAQRIAQHRQKTMNPLIRTRLTQAT